MSIFRWGKRVELMEVTPRVRGEFEYRYDMGDGWRHRLVIQTPPPRYAERAFPLPACIAGHR
jgi:hypothetical protein